MPVMKPKIGFIGQGFIGKNYADDFEQRGFEVVRYARGESYKKNKDKIKDCDIVFIAVPTPTTPEGFDDSIVRNVIKLVGKGKIVVIKSTMMPGTADSIQNDFKDIFIIHSPEFLREASSAYDAANPDRNIVGVTEISKNKGQEVLDVLPKAPYTKILPAKDAELIKYSGNVYLYIKVVFMNMLYDYAESQGIEFDNVAEAMSADPRIGNSHMKPVHKSGHSDAKIGRGAGGHCFIKDFAAFTQMYSDNVDDDKGIALLKTFAEKNNELLQKSNKDIDLLKGVYGDDIKI